MFRIGLLLSLSAVCLQIAVFLQPLLPKQYQIAPVCETITRAFFTQNSSLESHASYNHLSKPLAHSHTHLNHLDHESEDLIAHHVSEKKQPQLIHSDVGYDHHDANHQCQYCTVLGNLVLPTELNVQEVLIRIQVRLIAYQKAFKHVYFVLQRLFLMPQGRAPPLFA